MDTILKENLKYKTTFKGISGSTLKLIAILCMVLDHLSAIIIYPIALHYDSTFLFSISQLMRKFGRLAFPIFCFLLVEGMIYTHNKKKYAMRLGLFALISEIPFDLALNGSLFNPISQNVFFTLLIGLLVIIGFEKVRDVWKDKNYFKALVIMGLLSCSFITVLYVIPMTLETVNSILRLMGSSTELILNEILLVILIITSILVWSFIYKFISKKKSTEQINIIFADIAILFIGLLFAVILSTDYCDLGVITITIMYLLRNNRLKAMFGGCTALTILALNEFWAFFDIIPIYFYNGERGINIKYLFYAFYPAHLLIFYFINKFIMNL